MQSSSLQSFAPSTKRVMIPDKNGFPRYYSCDDPIVEYIRSVAAFGVLPKQGPHAAVGQPSLGSLPSATSLYSSQSSVGSAGTTNPGVGMPRRYGLNISLFSYFQVNALFYVGVEIHFFRPNKNYFEM